MIRGKIGALVRFYDVPTTQLWVGAVAIGLRYADENAPTGTTLSAILALAAISLVFFYLMGINDYFDVDVDAAKEGQSVLVKGELTMKEAKYSVLIVAALGLVLAALVSIRFLLFSLVIFAMSSLYSAPPVRYKRFYPISTVGEIAGAFMLFLVGYSVVGLPTTTAVFISTVTTLVAASARLRQEARRVDFDGLTGKGTVAVVHGARVARLISRVLVVAALVEVFALHLYGLLSGSTALLAGLFVVAPVLVKQVQEKHLIRLATLTWGFVLYLLVLFVPAF